MVVPNNDTRLINSIFKHCLADGIIEIDDVMNSTMEDIMTTILNTMHRYSIARTKDGRYTTYIPDPDKPGGRRQVRRKSESDLYEFLLKFYTGNNTSNKMTFSELFLKFIEYKKQFIEVANRKRSVSPSTIRRYERDYSNYISESELAGSIISEIGAPQLELMLRDIIKKHGLSEQCTKNVIGYVSQTFEYAWRSNFINTNPIELVDRRLLLAMCRFTPPKEDSERVLNIHELADLREAVLQHETRHPSYMPDYAIELAMLTGMRVGEIAALHWSDVDNEFIHINYSEHRLDFCDRPSEYVIGEPKNGKHRLVQMTTEAKKVLDKVKMVGFTSQEDFVFIRADGRRYMGHDISCAVARRAAEAGIKKTSIHGIRRTVSSMLNTVLPQKAVAEMLGHSERVNEQHYNYSMAENAEKRKALEAVSSKVINFESKSQNKRIAINA